MSTECLAIVVGVATIVNASALVYDVCRRHKKQPASFVQVRNKNEGGVEEFRTIKSAGTQGVVVENIWIRSDGTVEIQRSGGQIEAHGRYIKWKSH